jgi:hypothetical protein
MMRIISGILIALVAVMSFKKGLMGLLNTAPEGDKKLLDWGINKTIQTIINSTTMIAAVLILFPPTFLVGNITGAILFILLMGFQLHAGDTKAALLEMPFLLLTLLLVYAGHPLKHD